MMIPMIMKPVLFPTNADKHQNPNAQIISQDLLAASWSHAIFPLSFGFVLLLTSAEQIGFKSAIPNEIINVKIIVIENPLRLHRRV